MSVTTSPSTFICQGCNQVITKAIPRKRDQRKQYCSLACKLWRFYHKDGSLRRPRLRKSKPIKSSLSCVVCGVLCSLRRRMTCSDACAKERQRCVSREMMRSKRSLIPLQRVTVTCWNRTCQRVFVHTFQRGTGERKHFCSIRCMKRHARRGRNKNEARARHAGVELEYGINPLKVFQRDGWRCHLCGRRTPERLRGKNQLSSPEIDHIVPLAAGGGHVWENVACACRACNISKNSKPLGQLRLRLGGDEKIPNVFRVIALCVDAVPEHATVNLHQNTASGTRTVCRYPIRCARDVTFRRSDSQ